MEQLKQTVERMSQKAGGVLEDGTTLPRHHAGVCLYTVYTGVMCLHTNIQTNILF